MDYPEYIIKEYKYWTLNIHMNQGYLGRCILWCKRENAKDLTEATPEESDELFQILTLIKNALIELFDPDWFNYAFLGNELPHLHCHIIPRYKTKRTHLNVEFEDKLFGHNYQTDHNFQTSPELLALIKKEILQELEKNSRQK